MKRVFLIVLDSFGIGEMPDAGAYGDINVNTLRSVSQSSYFHMDHMRELGLFNIDGVEVGERTAHPTAAYARMTSAPVERILPSDTGRSQASILPSPCPLIRTVFPRRYWRSSVSVPAEIFCVTSLTPAHRLLRITGTSMCAPAN